MIILSKYLFLIRILLCANSTVLYRRNCLARIYPQDLFTSGEFLVKHENYCHKIKTLKVYALERGRERDFIIYKRKILGGLVSNLHRKMILME